MDSNVINLTGPDDFVVCPHCQRRVDVDTTPVERDPSCGPVYAASCPDHGRFLWATDPEDDEEGDDE